MDRQEALILMESKVTNKNLRKHIIAVEIVMKYLAKELGEDEAKWGLAGLLHDLDYEKTKNTPERHGLVTAELLKDKNVAEDILNAIKAHADKKRRETKMEKAIYCADPVTGFLVACALIKPEKRLSVIDVEFAKNRMKERRFAAGADRDRMRSCEALGLSLDRFFQIALDAMNSINDQLEL